jgi:hypothetical protein
MALFDIFSGQPARDAAAAQEAAARAGYAGLANFYTQGRGDITSGYGQARGDVTGLYGQAAAPWQSLLGDATQGWQAYADATGANGPAGTARAQAAFKTDPGYQFALNQSLDALNRAGVARGQATGNTMVDALNYASGAAAQQYGNYVSRLAPFLQQRDLGTAGLAGTYTGEAGALSGLATGQAGALAGLDIGQGGAYSNMYNRIGQAQSDAAMADYNASANMWNVGLNVLNAAAKAYGGGGGGGGSPSAGKNY